MSPVTLSFLSVIEDFLVDIFNQYLVPVLMIAFDTIWDLVAGLIMSWLNHVLFNLFTFLLKVLFILEKIFDVFSCTTGIYVMNEAGKLEATSGFVDVSKNASLLDVLMQSDLIVNAVAGMTAGAFVLCFLVTIFSVIRSMGEGIGELKRPVSHVVRQTARACLIFAIIPITCIFAVKMAGIVITTVSLYMPNNINGGANKDAAQLVSEALSNSAQAPRRGSKQSQIEKAIAAVKTVTPNADTRACDLIFYLTVKDALRNKDNAEYYLSGQHFQNTTAALEDVNVGKINWLYALFEALLVIIIFLKLIIECMVRVFMILILFVVSPYFVAMMPLDDGAKFKRWKEMFVAFTISVFGPILTMKTYLVLLPYMVTGDHIDFGFSTGNYAKWTAQMESFVYSEDVTAVGFELMIFRLFLIAAGGYAVYKSQNLMLDLINPEVSKFLAASGSVVDSSLGGAAQKAKGAAVKALKGLGAGGGGDQGGGDKGGGGGS